MEATTNVEGRVGKLEQRADSHQDRLDGMDKRMDKYEANTQRIWERLDQHRDGQVRTQTLVEVGNRDIAALSASFTAFRETQEKQRAAQELASKNNKPNWWLVAFTSISAMAAIVGVIVGVISLTRGGHTP